MLAQYDGDPQDFESRTSADKNVYVKFYIRPVIDQSASDEAGRPIYSDKEYIEIRTPGNQTNIVQRPVAEMDRQRFRQAYAMFKAGEVDQVVGTPLFEAPWITRSQVEELAHLRIRTLEQLSVVGDDVCTKVPGLFKLKQRAEAMVANAEKQAPFIALQQENEALRTELESLREAVKEQSAAIAALKKPAAK
jgi:hypothetical protein